MKKTIAIILALVMMVPAAVFAESGDSGGEWLKALEEKCIRINGQTELFSGWYENDGSASASGQGSTLLAESYMVYEPGEGVQPVVCFGNDVAGAAGFTKIAEIEGEAGNTVCAGINGDYFTMATGVAMGFIIKNGRVCSSERNGYESIGFMADGSVVIGNPGLNVGLVNETTGLILSQLCFNKTLTDDNGLVVYSKDFGPDNGAGKHRSVVVSIIEEASTEGEETAEADAPTLPVPAPGSTVRGVVESIETCEGARALEEGKLVLSISETTKYASVISAVEAMNVGDIIDISFGISEEWLDAVNAVGAERRLISAGVISENIIADASASKDSTRDPRTAFGIRADGSTVLYTADGRDKARSSGLTYLELAQRLLDLGCVEAVNLDGGGSTQIYAVYPGDEKVTQINQSSGGSTRRCADYLCLVNRAERTGNLTRLSIYPYKERVLAGATLPLTLKGSDEGWYAVDVASYIPVWSVSGKLGTVENSAFVAGKNAGTAQVSARVGGITGTAEIEIITRPDELNVTYGKDKALPECLYVYAGETVQFKATAIYNRKTLIADDACYTWTLSDGLGTLENGKFIAADAEWTEGFINVTAGEVSKSIPVTVYKDENPPVITGEISGNLLMANVTDERDWTFGKSNISVRYDGAKLAFEYTASGDVYATLPDGDGDLHHIVIEAKDARGNRSRLGLEVPTEAPLLNADGSEFTKTYIFSDLDGENVVTPYAEYLQRRNLMAGKLIADALVFDADANLTRQEFATVICKVKGLDPYKYESVELPFTDNDAISSWATLFVKAAYKEGYMAGKGSANGSVRFDPLGKITRQEVLTVLSKFLGEGYKSEALTCTDAADVSNWAVSFMELALNNGITEPEDGMLRPLDDITRGELARMLYAMD